ncbi:MAG: hypothetical protein AB7R90_18185 [Reyranellaceae bacterium]
MLATAAAAQVPVALVEDVQGTPAGVEFMDYLVPGKSIRLGPSDTIVLGYLKSCWRETITGGTLTVGAEQSEIKDGKLVRAKVDCDGGKMQLTSQQADKSGAMVFRDKPKSSQKAEAKKPELTLYGLSPVVDIKGGGIMVVERIDQPGERYEVAIGGEQMLRGAFYDFAKANKALTAGGTYQASVGTQRIVFKVDQHAQPGRAPLIGRLLRFQPAS